MCVVRLFGSSIPGVSEAKQYGNCGEDDFTMGLRRELPSCKIKRNVIISTPEGNAEIDCLILYGDKLFAIEVKRWKGHLTECEQGFVQQKTDRWTGETHAKYLKSPFKQLSRAIYLLRKQIPGRAWINGLVFFEGDELESIRTSSDNIWFNRYSDLANFIRNEGKSSFGNSAESFFKKCVAADCLYGNSYGKTLNCVIDRSTLQFSTPRGPIPPERIVSIYIKHHWAYDDLKISLSDGSQCVVTEENAKIRVDDNGKISKYSLCKLERIDLGRALTL